MSTEVELLRHAAALMRERAQAAPESPWAADGFEVYGKSPGIWVGEHVTTETAEHIAAFAAPAVALAVADWLDYSATWIEDLTPHAAGELRRRAGHALNVARAYLGEVRDD